MQEERLEENQKLDCEFVDLEKVYDRIPKEVVFWCLKKRKLPKKAVKLGEMMYRRTRTTVITVCGKKEMLEVRTGLHQELALSPCVFVLIMDLSNDEIRNENLCKRLRMKINLDWYTQTIQ